MNLFRSPPFRFIPEADSFFLGTRWKTSGACSGAAPSLVGQTSAEVLSQPIAFAGLAIRREDTDEYIWSLSAFHAVGTCANDIFYDTKSEDMNEVLALAGAVPLTLEVANTVPGLQLQVTSASARLVQECLRNFAWLCA